MWAPLLGFLKSVFSPFLGYASQYSLCFFFDSEEFPDAWTLAGAYESAVVETNDGEDESDSEDSEGEAGAGAEKPDEATHDMEKGPTKAEGKAKLAAYGDFLQFLQLGCAGSPAQGYPTVVIILSTLSSPVSSVHSFAARSY